MIEEVAIAARELLGTGGELAAGFACLLLAIVFFTYAARAARRHKTRSTLVVSLLAERDAAEARVRELELELAAVRRRPSGAQMRDPSSTGA